MKRILLLVFGVVLPLWADAQAHVLGLPDCFIPTADMQRDKKRSCLVETI